MLREIGLIWLTIIMDSSGWCAQIAILRDNSKIMTDDYSTAERLAIKCESGIPEAEAREQMRQEREDLLNCFARHILDTYQTPAERRAYLDKQEAKKGKAFADNLRRRVKEQWEARKK